MKHAFWIAVVLFAMNLESRADVIVWTWELGIVTINGKHADAFLSEIRTEVGDEFRITLNIREQLPSQQTSLSLEQLMSILDVWLLVDGGKSIEPYLVEEYPAFVTGTSREHRVVMHYPGTTPRRTIQAIVIQSNGRYYLYPVQQPPPLPVSMLSAIEEVRLLSRVFAGSE